MLVSKIKVWYFYLVLLFVLIVSCTKQDVEKGAIIYSFDDQYINEWFNNRELFLKYNIKATFFINRPHLLDSNKIAKLKQLEKDGHEIGCHGLNHLNVLDYTDSLDWLITNEILPAIKYLNDMGFDIKSYAHPYGKSSPKVDSVLCKYFKYLRKATWNINNTTIDQYNEIFVNSNSQHVMNSMGIDYNYKSTLDNLETGILRSINKNEVLVLHAHKIDTTQSSYTINPNYLEDAFKLCKQHNIKSIRISDLERYF